MAQDLFIGIDVSKDFLDISLGNCEQVQRLTNDERGLEQLSETLRDQSVKLIVMEATGGFHRLALATLLQRGLPTVAINPRQARDFAKALGLLEKNDRIDAKALQLFAERVRPPVRALPDEETQAFDELLTRRRQIIEMLIAEKNRGSHAQTTRVRKNIQEHVDWLKKQLRDTDRDLKEQVESSPAWNAKVELLEGIKGIGTVTAATLLSAIPELGTLNRKQVAKLAGLAPLCRDSGRQNGKRVAWGGRADARTALYMPTITAVRYNPSLRSFYQRLVAAGKPKKVALVAAMRKLLTIINAVVREHLLLQKPAQAT